MCHMSLPTEFQLPITSCTWDAYNVYPLTEHNNKDLLYRSQNHSSMTVF